MDTQPKDPSQNTIIIYLAKVLYLVSCVGTWPKTLIFDFAGDKININVLCGLS